MATLSIKNVPASVVERLRRRAALNHRSMQGELMALICKAVEAEDQVLRPLGSRRAGTVSIDEIAAEHRLQWAEPFDQAPHAVDIIRGDRDAR